MSLWNDIQPWIDKETGLMQAGDFGRDNLILMSAYLYRELNRLEEYGDAQVLLGRAFKFMTITCVEPGLYKKLPDSIDDNTEDNMVGNCYLSPAVACRIEVRWNHRFSCFDINHPNKIALNRNFFGRFFGLKAYIIACAGYRPWFIQRLIWCAAAVFSVWTSKGASDPLKLMLQCDRMEKYCPKTVAYWRSKYSSKSLYSDYFGVDNPLAKHSA